MHATAGRGNGYAMSEGKYGGANSVQGHNKNYRNKRDLTKTMQVRGKNGRNGLEIDEMENLEDTVITNTVVKVDYIEGEYD